MSDKRVGSDYLSRDLGSMNGVPTSDRGVQGGHGSKPSSIDVKRVVPPPPPPKKNK